MFITFEGIDGVGKSTQATLLRNKLTELGHRVIHTREPGGTRLGQQIRTLLLNVEHTEMSQQTEVLLYAADRAQHVAEVILPALKAGKIVICERYFDSSIAYQGYGLGWDRQVILEINQWAIQGVIPDLTICLDQEPGVALGKTGGDRIEQRDIEYYQRVRVGFHQLAKENAQRFHIISASGTPQQVFERVFKIISGRVLG